MKKRIAESFARSSIWENSALNIAIFLIYIFFGKAGLSLAVINPSASPIWAPTGIAIATFLIFGKRITPAILLGAFFVNVSTTGNTLTSFGVALGNTLEGLVGMYLVEKLANGRHAFDDVVDIFKYTFLAGFVATVISATIGVFTLILGNQASVSSFWSVWTTWWLGDMGGALVVAPFLLVWRNHPRIHFTSKGVLHFVLVMGGFLMLTHFIFSGIFPYPYLSIPVGVWIAFWFGRRGATVATLVASSFAVLYTINGIGPFAHSGSLNTSLLLLQMYLDVFAVTALVFATVLIAYRRSEKTVALQEKRFKALIEKSFDSVVLIDATSRISYASPSFEKIVGYTPREVEGKVGFELVHPEDRPRVMKELGKLVLTPGGTVTVEYRTIRKDEKIIWVEATGTNLLLDPLIHAVVVNFRDVTERKYHEDEVKQNEKRFRSLVEKSGEGIALIDKNGKIIYTTITVTDLLGYTQEEYEKQDPATLVHPDDVEAVQKKAREILKEPGASVSLQYRIKHKNGTYRWFDVLATNLLDDEAVHAYIVNFRDITETKNSEIAVRKEKIQDEAMLGSIGDGVIATDNTGKITMINARGAQILGWEEKDLVGKDIITAIPLEDELGQVLKSDERPITKVLTLGKPIITSSTVFYVRKDGTTFPVHFTVTPIVLENTIVGAIEVFHDITQEKAVDKAKSEFVSVASHQLRTPLATINWYLEELIQNASNLTEKQVSYLKEVYGASKRMVDLINALLNASRLELGTFVVEPNIVQIPDVVGQVIKDLGAKIEQKHVTISEKYEKNLPSIHADTKLLTIIIQNILGNAIKYTKSSDTIDVSVSHNEKEFLFTVTEHGYGIPKNQQDKIFTKLFRADNARMVEPEGTGLGLYIVKSIVTTTGGKIWFESEENKGTSFFVSFPLSGMKQKEGQKQLI